MKTFSQYLEEVNSKYIVSKNPSDKKWYVMGHVGNNKWMPVSNGFKNKAQAQKWAKSQDKVDIAARGEIDEVTQDKDIKDKKGTQPAKYYAGDMAKSTKDKRAAHFAKKKSGPAPGDASAKTKPSKHTKKYKQMFGEGFKVGDKVKIKTSGLTRETERGYKKFLGKSGKIVKDYGDGDMKVNLGGNNDISINSKDLVKEENLNEKIEGLKNKAEKSGMPYGILKKVYDRGMAAYKTGHRPGTTAQQWAFARVNSFVTKSKGTWGGADKDLAAKVRG